jgi:hypothetical protein
MSLEENIVALTAAINGLTAALGNVELPTQPEAGQEVVKKEKKSANQEDTVPAVKQTTKGTTTESVTEGVEEEPTQTPEELETAMKKAFATLIEKDINKAKEILASFKVAKLSALPAEKHARCLAKTLEAIDG